MRITVNLATRPFTELRPLFLRLRLVMGGLLLASVGLAVWAHVQEGKLERARGQMDALRTQIAATQTGKLRAEARMHTGPNAAILDRAHFLNALFLRKSFSWTAVMMDLEDVLPTGVQVTSIEPQVAANGDVVIRLRVAGERDRAVQLVRNLERSHRFLSPRLSGESAQAREGTGRAGMPGSATGPGGAGTGVATGPAGVEFDILADYNPLPLLMPNAGDAGEGAPAAMPAGRRARRAPGPPRSAGGTS